MDGDCVPRRSSPCWTSSLLYRFLLLYLFFWAFWYCMAVLTTRGTPWYPFRRYAGNPTFNQLNKVSPPLGTLEPREIGTPSRSTGTLEPRDIGTPSAHGGERAPTREPAKGTDPRNDFPLFRYPPWQSPAVSPLRVSLPSCSWRLRRLQVNLLFSLFPRLFCNQVSVLRCHQRNTSTQCFRLSNWLFV